MSCPNIKATATDMINQFTFVFTNNVTVLNSTDAVCWHQNLYEYLVKFSLTGDFARWKVLYIGLLLLLGSNEAVDL